MVLDQEFTVRRTTWRDTGRGWFTVRDEGGTCRCLSGWPTSPRPTSPTSSWAWLDGRNVGRREDLGGDAQHDGRHRIKRPNIEIWRRAVLRCSMHTDHPGVATGNIGWGIARGQLRAFIDRTEISDDEIKDLEDDLVTLMRDRAAELRSMANDVERSAEKFEADSRARRHAIWMAEKQKTMSEMDALALALEELTFNWHRKAEWSEDSPRGACRHRKATVSPAPAAISAAEVEFDEDGRRIITAPLTPAPRPAPTSVQSWRDGARPQPLPRPPVAPQSPSTLSSYAIVKPTVRVTCATSGSAPGRRARYRSRRSRSTTSPTEYRAVQEALDLGRSA